MILHLQIPPKYQGTCQLKPVKLQWCNPQLLNALYYC